MVRRKRFSFLADIDKLPLTFQCGIEPAQERKVELIKKEIAGCPLSLFISLSSVFPCPLQIRVALPAKRPQMGPKQPLHRTAAAQGR